MHWLEENMEHIFFFFFFFYKNTFCLLTDGFQLFLKFLCVSPTSFSCGVNLTFTGIS